MLDPKAQSGIYRSCDLLVAGVFFPNGRNSISCKHLEISELLCQPLYIAYFCQVLELRAALDVAAMQIQNGVKCLFMLLCVCTERKS